MTTQRNRTGEHGGGGIWGRLYALYLPIRSQEKLLGPAWEAEEAAAVANGFLAPARLEPTARERVPHAMTISKQGKTARLLRRIRNVVAGLFGAALATGATVSHGQTSVPQPWISYARLASGQFQAWLSDPASEAVQRLHARMQDRMLKADANQPPPALIVKVWVGTEGHVDGVSFNTLGDPVTDSDLQSILTSRPLSEPPPRDMKQPMILQLNLDYLP
jgi:hypothetical protein